MSAPPLLLLGYDVADVERFPEWLEAGDLPTLASLLARGARARTVGADYLSEYGLWISIASGVPRSEHGVYYYRQLVPGSYALAPPAPPVGAAPFWARLGADARIGVMDVPDTRPVPGPAGRQLCDWVTHQPTTGRRWPAARPRSLLATAARVGPRDRWLAEFDPAATPARDRAARDRLLARVDRKGDLCLELLGRDRFDLAALVFAECHPAGHRLWRYRDPCAGDADLAGAARDVHRAVDHQLGRVLDRVGPEANVVLVVSMGMRGGHVTAGLAESFCRRYGYQRPAAASAPSAPSAPARLRAAIGARLPGWLRERRLARRFRSATDWRRTRAFAIPGLHHGFIRVNLAGREPLGCVAPGADYEALLDEIEARLRTLVRPGDGRPAVERLVRVARLGRGGPPRALPDLVVEWAPSDGFLARLDGPGGGIAQERPRYAPESFHPPWGLLVAAGPSIPARGDLGYVDLLDVAPTCLALMGREVPRALTGRALFAGADASVDRR